MDTQLTWNKSRAEETRKGEARYRDSCLEGVLLQTPVKVRSYLAQPNGVYPRVEVDGAFVGLAIDQLAELGFKAVADCENGTHFVRIILSDWVVPTKKQAPRDQKEDRKEDAGQDA